MRLVAAALVAVSIAATAPATADDAAPVGVSAERPDVVVYRSPYCGCCGGWADHLEANGYRVTERNMTELDVVKRTAGVPERLESCHTAVVDGYVIEGHVPVSAIDRLLEQRPRVTGLAVPGMPIGSPGMEMGEPEPYDVMTFDAEGRTSVFMSVPGGN